MIQEKTDFKGNGRILFLTLNRIKRGSIIFEDQRKQYFLTKT